MDSSIVVSGMGIVSPTGIGAEQTFSTVYAGVSRMNEMPELYSCIPEDPDFDDFSPVVASSLSFFDNHRQKYKTPSQWLAFIAAQAYFDLIDNFGQPIDFENTGLFFSLPQKTTSADFFNEEEFTYHFHNLIEKDIFPDENFIFQGNTGVLELIEKASQKLKDSSLKYAIIGGVESYLFPEYLEVLDKNYRIKSSYNPDGFIPGESAAFILLEKNTGQTKEDCISINAISTKECSEKDLSNNTGIAMTEVLNELIEMVPDNPVFICDLNGEPARMKEWGFALSRMGESLGSPVLMEHPAESLGDLGAASSVVNVILAFFFLKIKFKSKSNAIVLSSSDNGKRAGLLLELYKQKNQFS